MEDIVDLKNQRIPALYYFVICTLTSQIIRKIILCAALEIWHYCIVLRIGALCIVSMIIGLGRSLDTIITAEGIEEYNQHILLRAAGCDQGQGQGFLYGKPLQRILEASEAKLKKQA